MKTWASLRLHSHHKRSQRPRSHDVSDGERLLGICPSHEVFRSLENDNPALPTKPTKSVTFGPYAAIPDRKAEAPSLSPVSPNLPLELVETVDYERLYSSHWQDRPSVLHVLGHPVITFTAQHKLILACSLPLLAVSLEAAMLILFLIIYMQMPIDPATGNRQRISPLYSTWPFISCVGSTRLIVYRIISLLCSGLSLVAAFISLYWSHDTTPGWYLRRFQFFETTVAGALLIALVFVAEFVSDDAHLMIVSIRLLFLYGAKTTGWLIWRGMRNTYPPLHYDYASSASYFWKTCLMFLAFPFCILANVGIYSCRDPDRIQTEGSTCYRMIAAAAVSDWLYAVVNMVFLINLAYDLYHSDHYSRARQGETLTPGMLMKIQSETGLEARRDR